jgi:DNA-binding transcriptional ArsR family regulator
MTTDQVPKHGPDVEWKPAQNQKENENENENENRAIAAQFAQAKPLLTALGDERRQAIIVLLLNARSTLNVGEIAVRMDLSQPAVSHHLKILRDARLLTVARKGTQRLYSLNAEGYAEVLAPIRDLVDSITACSSPAPNEPTGRPARPPHPV